jgi:hypothetical protein
MKINKIFWLTLFALWSPFEFINLVLTQKLSKIGNYLGEKVGI